MAQRKDRKGKSRKSTRKGKSASGGMMKRDDESRGMQESR